MSQEQLEELQYTFKELMNEYQVLDIRTRQIEIEVYNYLALIAKLSDYFMNESVCSKDREFVLSLLDQLNERFNKINEIN